MNQFLLQENDRLKKKFGTTYNMKEYYPDIAKYHSNELLSFFDSLNMDYHVKRKKIVKSIDSSEKLAEYIKEKKKAFAECLGIPPGTELNSKLTGTLDKGRYLVDKVLIESLPGYYITADFYYPSDITGKCPAILFLCGHTDNGKAGDTYASFCVEAVLNGFCVLTFDPVGQGERQMYGANDHGMFAPGSFSADYVHILAGRQFVLGGETISGYMMRDNICALDYLCQREEVDKGRIAVSGQSGGGHMSAFMGAYDERLCAVAPCCYLTEMETMLYHVGASEDEQSMPNFMKYGLDLPDLITMAAPRPYYIGASLFDFFPIDGMRDAYTEARKMYRLLGKEDEIEVYVSPKPHGLWRDQRRNVLRFLCKHMDMKYMEGCEIDCDDIPTEAELTCVDGGDVNLVNKVSLQEMLKGNVERCYGYSSLHSIKKFDEYVETLKKKVYETLSIDSEAVRSDIIVEKTSLTAEGLFARDIAYLSEEKMKVYCTIYEKNELKEKKSLFVHVGAISEDKRPGLLKDLLKKYSAVASIEMRGTGRGEVTPGCFFYDGCYVDNEEERYNCNADMLGRSVLGMRVMDILSGIRLLSGLDGYRNAETTLYGCCENALIALYSAVLGRVSELRVENMLYSYKSIIDNRVYSWNPSVFAYGILKNFDIPELIAALTTAKVTISGLVDNMKNKIDQAVVTEFQEKVCGLTGHFERDLSVSIE